MKKPSKNSPTFLVVDDEPTILEVMSVTLEAGGFHCVCANDGREALEVVAARGTEIGGMITDLHMPDMTGIELIQRVRELDSKMHVVVSTGYMGDEERDALESLGVTATLRKPYTGSELLKQVRAVVDLKACA